jgi:hypothetical protein
MGMAKKPATPTDIYQAAARKALIVALARKLLTPSSVSPKTRRECHQ